MSDQFSLANLFNQPQQTMRDYYQQEADRTAHVPAVLDVPVRIVPPPVTLKGEVKFIATFPSDQILGKRYEEVVQMIMNAFETAGLEPNPLLPELRIHSLQAWREEVGRPDTDRTPSGAVRPNDGEHNAIRAAERESSRSVKLAPIDRGDALVAAAEHAIAGIRQDGPGGGEEYLTDSDAGDADDSVAGR